MKPLDSDFLYECKGITQIYDKLMGTWSIDSGILHIHSELSEVKEVLRNKNQKYGDPNSREFRNKLLEEIADVFLTTLSLTNILSISNHELNSALIVKLSIVKERVLALQGEIKNE